MRLKLNKTLKIGAVLLASIGISSLTIATVMSCSSTTPPPTRDQYENWTWEVYAKGEYNGIKPGIDGMGARSVKEKG